MNAPLPLKVAQGASGPVYDSVARGSNEVAGLLARRLSEETQGEALFSPGDRGRYATDASIYQIMPVGRVRSEWQRRRQAGPGHLPRPEGSHRRARRGHQPVRPDGGRGPGDRSQQACTQDPALRCEYAHGRSRAGHGAGPPEPGAEKTRALVPRRRVDQRPGHAGRHGGQQLLRQPQHRLRQHGAQRDRRAGLDIRWRAAPLRALRGQRGPRARHRQPRQGPGRAVGSRDRQALAQGDAARGRLQPGHLPQPERAALHAGRRRQPGPPAGGQRGHAGADAFAHAAAGRTAQGEGAGRGQLPHLLQGHGCRAAHRQAGHGRDPDRGGTGRSHHDRPVAAEPGLRAGDPHRRDRPARCGAAGGVFRRRQGRAATQARATGRADGRPGPAGLGGADDR